MKRILSIILLLPAIASAAPFVTSDPTTQKVTHCGILLDSGAKLEIPVTSASATTAICKYDVGNVTIGTHTIKATFINVDPTWGKTESPYSIPLSFERPNSTVSNAPTGLDITK
jgi:hypothetical protein